MKILTLGDVTGARAVEYLRGGALRSLATEMNADAAIINGENADGVAGISPGSAESLLEAGADVVTTGNHVWGQRDFAPYIEHSTRVLRPANFPAGTPGCGYTIININGYRLLVMNLLGVAFMEPLRCPFETADAILKREEGRFDFAALDLHAESTAEKYALARWLDGRVHLIFGTHTHVQTADETVLPRGSGYITDVGMCGPSGGVLGVAAELSIRRMRTRMPVKFECAEGKIELNGALFELDEASGRVISVKRVRKTEK